MHFNTQFPFHPIIPKYFKSRSYKTFTRNTIWHLLLIHIRTVLIPILAKTALYLSISTKHSSFLISFLDANKRSPIYHLDCLTDLRKQGTKFMLLLLPFLVCQKHTLPFSDLHKCFGNKTYLWPISAAGIKRRRFEQWIRV